MLYTSVLNWLFFGAFVLVYWFIPARSRAAWIAAGSIAILAFNDFIAGIIALYLVSIAAFGPIWAVGRRMARIGRDANKGNSSRIKIWILAALTLLPLLLIKYPVLLGTGKLSEALGIAQLTSFALPVGLSYLTFKALMYALDVSKGAIEPRGLPSVIAYILFLPAASAGPIDKPNALITQFCRSTGPSLELFSYGAYRIVVGLFFKFVLSQIFFSRIGTLDALTISLSAKKLLLFGPLYSLMLYFDFAGYSHIAIGAAAFLGIAPMENFRSPLLKPNISEFWRSWHISLMNFLRDYVYLPLAFRWAKKIGSNNAAYAAAFSTFAICGLWHGDGLNFILWGLWHGLLVSLHQAFLLNTRKSRFWKRARKTKWLALPSTLFTFLLVSAGWLLFAFKIDDLIIIARGGK